MQHIKSDEALSCCITACMPQAFTVGPCVLTICLPCFCAGHEGQGLVPGASLRERDFVYVTFTTVGRHQLATASRVWRKVHRPRFQICQPSRIHVTFSQGPSSSRMHIG